ncbi:MAG: reverse transcriptase domain-containing protein [Streptosporangiaceae bacterium]|jgi:hypothetical protein
MIMVDDHFAGQWQQLMKTSWQRQARRKRGLGNWKMIRFADDFVVMVAGERQHAEALREEVTGVLAMLGLRLAPEKTRVVHIDEGFDFLSITIRRMRKRGTSRHYVYTKPSKKAIQAVKDKVTAKTYRSTLYQEPAVLIPGISAVDSHAWNRIMRWLRRKYQGRTGLGMPELRRRFCVPGTWKLAHNGVVFTGASTVPAVRYRYRGTRIPSPYPEPPAGRLGPTQPWSLPNLIALPVRALVCNRGEPGERMASTPWARRDRGHHVPYRRRPARVGETLLPCACWSSSTSSHRAGRQDPLATPVRGPSGGASWHAAQHPAGLRDRL